MAQDLMLIMNLDLELTIQKEEDRFKVQIVPKSTPPAIGKRAILSSEIYLEGIKRIEFEDQFTDTVLVDSMNLTFFSKGFTMNHGILKMSPKNAASEAMMIRLPGHPAPLNIETAGYKKLDAGAEADFIERLSNVTFQETSSTEPATNDTEKEETPPNAP